MTPIARSLPDPAANTSPKFRARPLSLRRLARRHLDSLAAAGFETRACPAWVEVASANNRAAAGPFVDVAQRAGQTAHVVVPVVDVPWVAGVRHDHGWIPCDAVYLNLYGQQ